MQTIYAIATMDSKGEEIAYVADCCRRAGAAIKLVDVGTKNAPRIAPDIARETVAAAHAEGADAVLGHDDRGTAVTAMGEALAAWLVAEHAAGHVAGVIGLGGTGGTALIAPALRALPIGVPKLLVSTVASGDTRPYIEGSDICLMNSVVDVAGINRVSRLVLANAAHAISGMVREAAPRDADERPTVGLTMFGVTTPCIDAARERLDAAGFDCLVFHATGSGGRSMERLVREGLIQGVLDLTTTEVPDHLVGGVFAADETRFDAIVEAGIPAVFSFGACDMVNFGARDTVPAEFADRTLHVHNAQVTLMRTTPEENRAIGRWIARKLDRATAPIAVLIPRGGVSLIDVPGAPFHDPAADEALFDAFTQDFTADEDREIVDLPCDINHPDFAAAATERFLRLAGQGQPSA